jgi:hypothetical protein
MIKTGMGPEPTPNKELVLIQIMTKGGDNHTKEAAWAKPLGDDLYEIEHPLNLITGFNVGDVVKAVAISNETMPSVLEVIKRSGHQTLHNGYHPMIKTDS